MAPLLVLCVLLLQAGSTSAFVVRPSTTTKSCHDSLSPSRHHHRRRQGRAAAAANTLLFSSTKDDDAGEPQQLRTSFDDAGRGLVEEDTTKRLEEMGDFDSNPASNEESMEKLREAIRARAKDMGLAKSSVSQEELDERRRKQVEEERAQRQQEQQQQATTTPVVPLLDLSQISTGNEYKSKESKWDEALPSMMYDPADDMTEEEQKEADPIGQLPWKESFIYEFGQSKWPDFASVVREVLVMVLVAALSGVIIIGWDGALRNFYTDLGMIPRMEDIPSQLEGLDLPDGFTNNMNENDLAGLVDDMSKAGQAAGLASPSVEALIETTIKTATPIDTDVPDL